MRAPSIWIQDSGFWDRVDSLQPTPGYCAFIDIVGSTELKQQSIRRWINRIDNCFKLTAEQHHLGKFSPLKAIGDALMYYIEDSDLKQSGVTPFELFHSLWLIATEDRREVFPVVKIGAVRCVQVYSLTFLKGSQDYYGLEIDLAARLQAYTNVP
jgi:hypothetical protein